MRRSVAIWAVMLGGLLTSSVQGTAPVPPAEQDATRAVRGEFRNPVTPSSTWSTPTLFSGNLNGAVGTPVNPASTPNDGTRYLIRSRIGHPVGGGAPFASFVANSIDHGRKLLYYGEADNIPPGSDNPAAGQYSRELAAYRYKDLMYGELQSGLCLANPEIACLISDECPTGDTCGTQVSYVANLLEARIGNGLMTMQDFYGPAERARSEEAERALRNALKYSPLSTSLRNELLDVYYDRTVAELSLAKANRIDAFKERILAPPGSPVLDQEIQRFEAALGTESTPGGFRFALKAYFELINDPMGVDVGTFDPVAAGSYFGFYILRESLPGRSLTEATYLSSGIPTGVVSGGPPTQLYSGYRDLVLLFDVLGEYADTAAELALRYLSRQGPAGAVTNICGTGTDTDDTLCALQLVKEAHQKLYIEGNVLAGLAPTPGAEPPDSGLSSAISRWAASLSRLAELRTIEGSGRNILGFEDDFLMLVVTNDPDPNYTTFDKFLDELEGPNPNSRLNIAQTQHDQALERVDSFRGNESQLSAEFTTLTTDFDEQIRQIVGVSDPLDPCNCYFTPHLNEGGEIYLQAQSIQIAAQDIKRNGVRLSNLKREIEIENERYGKERGVQDMMKRIVVRYGGEQARLTERIGQIEADQLAWEKGSEAATSFLDNGLGEMVESKGTSLFTGALSAGIQAYNAKMQYDMELKKSKLKADKERRAADEKAEILDAEGLVIDADHQATVKRLLLQMSEIAVDSAESALVLQQEQARLTALFDTWQALETRRDRVLANLSQRYFADPIHRLRMDTSLVRAERSFKDAQKWVFFLARALEYEWNTVLAELPGGGHSYLGDNYSVDSIYRARNTPDLQNIVAGLKDYNSSTQSIVVGARKSWFSLRDDFLGLDGDDVAFRARLQQLIASDPGGKLILDFSTARDLGPAYPLYGADGWNDKIDTIRVHAVGLGGSVSGLLSYGGNGFVRNQNYGTPVPGSPDLVVGEERTYGSRYWYFDTIADDWTFTDDQRATIQVYPATSPMQGGLTPPSTPIQDFQQRSVAATGWVLELPAGVDLSQVTDIELFIEHRSATRQ